MYMFVTIFKGYNIIGNREKKLDKITSLILSVQILAKY